MGSFLQLLRYQRIANKKMLAHIVPLKIGNEASPAFGSSLAS
jgi:hypothetical protein